MRRVPIAAASALAAIAVAASAWLHLLIGDTAWPLVTLPLPLTGLVILARRPGQAVGWCLYTLGVAASGAGFSDAFLRLTRDDGTTLARTVAGGINQVSFVAMLVALGYLLLVFPTGRPRTRRWRWATRLTLASLGLLVLSGWFGAEPMDPKAYGPGVVSPGALSSEAASSVLGGAGFIGMFTSYALGIVCLVLRFVRAGDEERAQLKWFALTAGLGTFLVLVGPLVFPGPAGERFFDMLIIPLFAVGVPASIALAVLKYRLYDIDVIVNRTLVYGALTAVLVGAYSLGVLVFRTLLDPLTGDNDIAIAASTLAVAALFGPARRKIQAFIDHRFYRSRYDAQQTLESFATRLRDEVDLDALSGELLDVVSNTVRPRHASVWLTKAPAP
ncbi:MAG TPA: hypothetical protein VM784_07745 [Actinomycetota bacterium]|nr:hypothetical protein [Actinomycetota bacterium]